MPRFVMGHSLGAKLQDARRHLCKVFPMGPSYGPVASSKRFGPRAPAWKMAHRLTVVFLYGLQGFQHWGPFEGITGSILELGRGQADQV